MSFLFWLYVCAGVIFSVLYDYVPTKETIWSLGAWALFVVGILGWLPILLLAVISAYLDRGKGI